jgi:hypothetical protein
VLHVPVQPHGRGVELSEAGHRLFPQVKDLLARAHQHVAHRPAVRCGAHAAAGREPQGAGGFSGQVEEWLTDARLDIAIFYRYRPMLPEQEEPLAMVDGTSSARATIA